jgi:chromosome segregation ATPase
MKIDPSIRKNVDDFLSSLDSKKLNANELEKYSKDVAKVTDNLQLAFKSNDKDGFNKASLDLTHLAMKMGATEQQAYALTMSYDDLKKAQENANNAVFAGKDGLDGMDDSASGLTDTVDGLSGSMNGLAGATDGATNAFDKNISAAEILFGVTSDQIQQLQTAIAVFQALSGQQGLSAQQEGLLAQATSILAAQYPQLNGQIAENIGWISSQVGMMGSLSDVSGANAATMIANQNSTTKATIAQINQRIAGYQKEIQALQSLMASIESAYEEQGMNGAKTYAYNNAQKRLAELTTQMASAQASRIEAYYNSGVKTGQVKPYTPSSSSSSPSKGSSSSSGKSAVDKQKEAFDKMMKGLDAYDNKINSYKDDLSSLDLGQSKVKETTKAWRDLEQERARELGKQKEYQQQAVNYLQTQLRLNKNLTAEQKDQMNNEIINRMTEINNLQISINDSLEKIVQSKIDEVIDKYSASIDNLDNSLKQSQLTQDHYNEGSKEWTAEANKQVSIMKQKIAQNQAEISSLQKLLQTEKLSTQQKDDLNKKIQELTTTQLEYLNAIDSTNDQIMKNALDQKVADINKQYDAAIDKLQKQLDLLNQQEKAEERIKQLKEIQAEIDKAKSDTRFEYIDANGKVTLTYDKAKVAELEQQKKDLQTDWAKQDQKDALQKQIDDLNAQRDKYIQQMNTLLETYVNKAFKNTTDLQNIMNQFIKDLGKVYGVAIQLPKHHEGGIAGSKPSPMGALINKIFNVKPNETVAKLLKGEVVINPNLPHVQSNMNRLLNGLTPNVAMDGGNTTHINLNGVTIQANDANQFFKSLDLYIRMNKS